MTLKVGDTVRVKVKRESREEAATTKWKEAKVIAVVIGIDLTVEFDDGTTKWLDWDDTSWSID